MKDDKNLRDDLHKEFQVERMILFSDAVFAIVITLMAIEIHIPETTSIQTHEELTHALLHLVPTILAYIVSFIFIGSTWYQHLKLFSVVKSFDGRLVFHNLLLLFTVGLFPFTATVIARSNGQSMVGFYIYLGVILFSLLTLALLEKYILVDKPHLRNNSDITQLLKTYKDRELWTISMLLMLIVVLGISFFIENPAHKSVSMAAFAIFPIIYLIMRKITSISAKKKSANK
ncbi:MAG: DUF1211 domain-containing protein [Bacteroidia bacterium]|jgi:uncharacterized membrane protein|nr:DUF1211 domain-containing protein [Bacteroidia bacterium]